MMSEDSDNGSMFCSCLKLLLTALFHCVVFWDFILEDPFLELATVCRTVLYRGRKCSELVSNTQNTQRLLIHHLLSQNTVERLVLPPQQE